MKNKEDLSILRLKREGISQTSLIEELIMREFFPILQINSSLMYDIFFLSYINILIKNVIILINMEKKIDDTTTNQPVSFSHIIFDKIFVEY